MVGFDGCRWLLLVVVSFGGCRCICCSWMLLLLFLAVVVLGCCCSLLLLLLFLVVVRGCCWLFFFVEQYLNIGDLSQKLKIWRRRDVEMTRTIKSANLGHVLHAGNGVLGRHHGGVDVVVVVVFDIFDRVNQDQRRAFEFLLDPLSELPNGGLKLFADRIRVVLIGDGELEALIIIFGG